MAAAVPQRQTPLKKWISDGCVCVNTASGGNDDVNAVPVAFVGLELLALCRRGGQTPAWDEPSVAPEEVFFCVRRSAFVAVTAPSTLRGWVRPDGENYAEGRDFFVVSALVGRRRLTASEILRKKTTGALRYESMARPPRPHRTSVRRRHPRRSSCRQGFSERSSSPIAGAAEELGLLRLRRPSGRSSTRRPWPCAGLAGPARPGSSPRR